MGTRVDMRSITNKPGVTYDPTNLKRIFAEDTLDVKEAIDDATKGINTQQLEINGSLVINDSGNITSGAGAKPAKDKKQGSDCDGSDGDQNRVLTLSNSNLTTVVQVVIDGTYLMEDQDYTVNHKSSATELTFSNQVWDDQYIEVIYFA